MLFYLGSHHASARWFEANVPLFVSHRTLRDRRSLPKATAPWALDSGAFSELTQHGDWQTSETEYIEAVQRYSEEIGNLAWAAPMDWMCEPFMVERTGLSVEEHQDRTVQNYLVLREAGPFIPVLQGWTLPDYEHCVALYRSAGVDLALLPLVGLGSVCRRQHTAEIGQIVRSLSEMGLRMHGFGVKLQGLASYGYMLDSADSMAWSYRARRDNPLPGCSHKSCANCLRFALMWRRQVLNGTGQLSLLEAA